MRRISIFILIVVSSIVIVSACSYNSSKQSNSNNKIITHKNQLSFPYPLVKWNNHVYKITDESVDVVEVDKEIGEIEYQSLNEDEETHDNFSTTYSKGTKLYSIKGIETNKAIAVQTKEGNYVKVVSSSL